jgi:hypothetical protein
MSDRTFLRIMAVLAVISAIVIIFAPAPKG